MNFLSHFYFDRFTDDPYLALGTVLPDLLKNANKKWNPHPHKNEVLFKNDLAHQSILAGWKRHLYVDKQFHSAVFFNNHVAAIKEALGDLLKPSKVWPSFLAHVSLELMLDSLLLTEGMIDADQFYHQLDRVDRQKIASFLKLNGIEESATFFTFYEKFISSRYLYSYRDGEQIVYALNRISMRLWPEGLQQTNSQELTKVLIAYREILKADFRNIFNEIQLQLDGCLKP